MNANIFGKYFSYSEMFSLSSATIIAFHKIVFILTITLTILFTVIYYLLFCYPLCSSAVSLQYLDVGLIYTAQAILNQFLGNAYSLNTNSHFLKIFILKFLLNIFIPSTSILNIPYIFHILIYAILSGMSFPRINFF